MYPVKIKYLNRIQKLKIENTFFNPPPQKKQKKKPQITNNMRPMGLDGHILYTHRLYTDFLSEGLIFAYQQAHQRINNNRPTGLNGHRSKRDSTLTFTNMTTPCHNNPYPRGPWKLQFWYTLLYSLILCVWYMLCSKKKNFKETTSIFTILLIWTCLSTQNPVLGSWNI